MNTRVADYRSRLVRFGWVAITFEEVEEAIAAHERGEDKADVLSTIVRGFMDDEEVTP